MDYDKTKYIAMSRNQDAEGSHRIKAYTTTQKWWKSSITRENLNESKFYSRRN
jgi:hypothetical protein